jgi:hypothetical protein
MKLSQQAFVSDRAALSVAKNRDVFPLYHNVDVSPYLMHEMDKPMASALGKLVRSSKRVQVNPFPEGVEAETEFKSADTYVRTRGGLDDDEDAD